MSRRRNPSSARSTEHVFTQALDLHCPLDSTHGLVSVYGDMPNIRVTSQPDMGGGVAGGADVPLACAAGRLRVQCPHCRRAGRRTDLQVRVERVVAVVGVMREHGPHELRLPLDGAALAQFVERHPPCDRDERALTVRESTAAK